MGSLRTEGLHFQLSLAKLKRLTSLRMAKSTLDTYIPVDDAKIDRASDERMSSASEYRSIDSLEISMQDAYDSINQDAEIGRALIRLVSTVIFWIIASFALSRRPRTTLQWDQVLAVMDALATNGENVVTDDTPLQFYNIGSIDDVYTWLSNTLVPSVFTTEDFKGDTLPEYQQGRVATFNKVLGGVLIDVTRKAAKSCNADDVVTELYPNCSDSDNTTLERTFMNIKLNSTEASQFIDELKTSDKGINYYTKKMAVTIATYNGDFEGYSITTLEVNFGDSGYIKPTSATNSTEASQFIDELKTSDKGINYYTKKMAVTIATYNGDFEGYSITTLEVNFGDSGYIKPTSATNSARGTPYQGKNAAGDAIYASTYLIWLFVILYWGTDRSAERREVLKNSKRLGRKCHGIRRLVPILWRICAIGGSVPVFAAIWAVIEYKMNTVEFHSNLLKLADSRSDAEVLDELLPVVDLLNSMTTWTYVLALVGAIVSIQIGLYTLFQLSFHPQLSIFTRTMSSALRQFAAFFVVWIIAFLIFVCVGSILFGSDVEEFSTRLLTTQACINMLFGTFDYDSIKDLQFAFIFYWCFMIVVSLVLLNLMLAIVLDAYTVVREESYKGEASLMLNGRIRDFCLDKFHGKNPARCSAASSQPSDNNVEAQLLYDRIKADILV